MAAQWTLNPTVGGSIPPTPTILVGCEAHTGNLVPEVLVSDQTRGPIYLSGLGYQTSLLNYPRSRGAEQGYFPAPTFTTDEDPMTASLSDLQLFGTRFNERIMRDLGSLGSEPVRFDIALARIKRVISEFITDEMKEGWLKIDPVYINVLVGGVDILTAGSQLNLDPTRFLNMVERNDKILLRYGAGDTTKPKWNVWGRSDLQTKMVLHALTEEEALETASTLLKTSKDQLDVCRVGRQTEDT